MNDSPLSNLPNKSTKVSLFITEVEVSMIKPFIILVGIRGFYINWKDKV